TDFYLIIASFHFFSLDLNDIKMQKRRRCELRRFWTVILESVILMRERTIQVSILTCTFSVFLPLMIEDFVIRTLGKNRTFNLWLRTPTLYPFELQGKFRTVGAVLFILIFFSCFNQ